MEIERKFLVTSIPDDLSPYPSRHIKQVYVSTSPVIRAREKGEDYILTVKGEGFLQREEFELPLTKEQFKTLSARAEGRAIGKTRYLIPYGKYTIELDIFEPPFDPLVLAEVEFSTAEEANNFTPPDWFGEEVTYDPSYTNAAMSRRKL